MAYITLLERNKSEHEFQRLEDSSNLVSTCTSITDKLGPPRTRNRKAMEEFHSTPIVTVMGQT